MDILTLLTQAESAGLIVEAKGDQLVIRGPKRAAALVQELARQKVTVLTVLAAEAQQESTECQEGKADTDVGPTSEKYQSGHPCPTGRSMKQSQYPPRTDPASITYGGKTYEVAAMHGVWFFRAAADAGWTACSTKFASIIEERLQRPQAFHRGTLPPWSPYMSLVEYEDCCIGCTPRPFSVATKNHTRPLYY